MRVCFVVIMRLLLNNITMEHGYNHYLSIDERDILDEIEKLNNEEVLQYVSIPTDDAALPNEF